jgi:tryptophan 2,3-dioxygenase
MSQQAPNYWDYLRLPQLLSLQGGLEDDESRLMPDELHFIIVHQAFELWFKLMIRELRLARDHMAAEKVAEETVPYVVHHLRRIHAILELCARQFGVMETLTPQDFLAFRDKLAPASGFQSFQLRMLEVLLGLEGKQREESGFGDPIEHIRKHREESPAAAAACEALEGALREQSLLSALRAWLHRTPIMGSTPADGRDEAVVADFVGRYLDSAKERTEAQKAQLVATGVLTGEQAEKRFADGPLRARAFLDAEDVEAAGGAPAERARARRVRAAILFIESYRELPLLAWPRVLLDAVVELEELLVLFRTRHARMVERVIGRRVGTGGSAGVDYLDRTTKYRIFTELWAVRTLLLPRVAVPELRGAELYGFAR